MVLVRGADVSQEALEIEREQRRAAEGGVDITRDGVQRAIEAAKRTAPPPQDPLLGEMRRLGRSAYRPLSRGSRVHSHPNLQLLPTLPPSSI